MNTFFFKIQIIKANGMHWNLSIEAEKTNAVTRIKRMLCRKSELVLKRKDMQKNLNISVLRGWVFDLLCKCQKCLMTIQRSHRTEKEVRFRLIIKKALLDLFAARPSLHRKMRAAPPDK